MYRPKITLLVDTPNWAFDHVARSIKNRLSHKFEFKVKYVSLYDKLDASQTDLIHVFFWGEDYYKQFGFEHAQVVKEVASLRWKYEQQFGYLSVSQFANDYLDDCSCAVTPARSICEMLEGHVNEIFHLPNGVECDLFRPPRAKRSTNVLTIGWVGNPDDSTKGLRDILIPAARGHRLIYTNGRMTRFQLSKLYRQMDVIAIASIAESQPLPLLEGMASGCFPITTNVGIVPEIIKHGVNGLIVGRDVQSFRERFEWCSNNLDTIRTIGLDNRLIAQNRAWENCIHRYEAIYMHAFQKRSGTLRNNVTVYFKFPELVSANAIARPTNFRSIWTGRYRIIIAESFSRLIRGDRFHVSLIIRQKRAAVRLCKLVAAKLRKLRR